jgi:hypothetical protein
MTYHVELLPAQRQAANAGELRLQVPIPLRLNESPDRCSYVCQGDRMTFRWPPFWGCGWYSGRSIAGLRTRQGWAAPGGARKLLLGHAQQVRWGRGRPANRSKASRVRGSRLSGQAAPGAWALAGGRADVAVDLAGDVTLQAADDLRLGFPFRGAALGVGTGGRVTDLRKVMTETCSDLG